MKKKNQKRSYWLLKSEPSQYSWQDLAEQSQQTDIWDGVRNYQARNFLKTMNEEDLAFFYHSAIKEPALIGIIKIIQSAQPDPSQFEKGNKYFCKHSTV